MVTIVGRDPGVVKRVTCKGCAAVLEYTKNEVQQRTYSCMGDPSGHEYVCCPSCGGEAVIKAW